MYDIDGDINVVQKMIIADKQIMALLDLTGKSDAEIGKRIIKKSKWDDLLGVDKRLCAYPMPSRPTRNEIIFEELIEIDCHVPATQDFIARQIIGRVVDTLKSKPINGRYLTFKGQLGELPTVSGFYCIGVKFGYYSPV